MLGKIVGAYVGGKAAERVRGLDGPVGAALGVLAPVLIRRLSWPAMAAIGIGGYVAKRLSEGKPGSTAGSPTA